jgi:DNA-binding NtrC family response regulator
MNRRGRKTLLIIDDEQVFCSTIRDFLSSDSLEVLAAHTGADGLAVCASRKIDLVLLDQKLPDGEGHALAPQILEKNELTKIIFITAFPSFENAVLAVRSGANDYLSKPFDLGELKLTVDNMLHTLDLERAEQVQNYTREKDREAAVIVGNAGQFGEARRLMEMASTLDAPVLLTGETGTGKSLVAKTIHYRSAAAAAPFISINCAALPENLIEAELFGYEKGAFTGAAAAKKGLFEIAEGGTIFLDEIGEMPMHLQTKLLGVLEERTLRRIGGTTVTPVNVRVIAATNSDLDHALGKTFRKDLYYRLSVVRIHIPPLREHAEDIPELASHLLSRITRGRVTELPVDELNALASYDWPGNVRELGNVLERAVFLQKGDAPAPSLQIRKSAGTPAIPATDPDSLITLAQAEQNLIRRTLANLSGNLTHTAKTLDISLSTLKRKLREYGLK